MMVAGRITSMLHENLVIRPLLGLASGHIPFPLLGHDIRNPRLLGLEVIADGLRIIRSIPLLEHRLSFYDTSGVFNAVSMHRTAVHIHRDDLGSQFDILIVYLTATIQRSRSSQRKHQRVVRLIYDRSIQRLFFLGRSNGIDTQGIPFGRLRYPKRIILCSIGANHPPSSSLRHSLIGEHEKDNQQYR